MRLVWPNGSGNRWPPSSQNPRNRHLPFTHHLTLHLNPSCWPCARSSKCLPRKCNPSSMLRCIRTSSIPSSYLPLLWPCSACVRPAELSSTAQTPSSRATSLHIMARFPLKAYAVATLSSALLLSPASAQHTLPSTSKLCDFFGPIPRFSIWSTARPYLWFAFSKRRSSPTTLWSYFVVGVCHPTSPGPRTDTWNDARSSALYIACP